MASGHARLCVQCIVHMKLIRTQESSIVHSNRIIEGIIIKINLQKKPTTPATYYKCQFYKIYPSP